MSKTPLVSYVVATFNCGKRANILNETARQFKGESCEFIVMDGGSTDETLNILRLENNLNIVGSSRDEGIYDAWNKAIKYCKGEYISFIGVDDIPTVNFLKEVAALLLRLEFTPTIIYGDGCYTRHNKYRCFKSYKLANLFYSQNPFFDIPHPGCFNHKSLFVNVKFNSSYKSAGDLDFYLRQRPVILKNQPVYLPILQVVIDADGLTHSVKGAKIFKKEVIEIEKKLNLKINYSQLRLNIVLMMGKIPYLFESLRHLNWQLRHDKKPPL